MIVVLPVCAKDEPLARLNLEWVLAMEGRQSFDCVISHEYRFDVSAVKALAEKYFSKVTENVYPRWTGPAEWPKVQNYAWQSAARAMEMQNNSWFWWEQDAVPLCPGWLKTLDADYRYAKKPFMGYWFNDHPDSQDGYMAGVGIYPPNVSFYSVQALIVEQFAFDIILGKSIRNHCQHTDLIDHRREPVTFNTHAEALDILGGGAVLFHKCKDGSLIEHLAGKKHSLKNIIPRQAILPTSSPSPKPSSNKIPVFYHSGDAGDIIYGLLCIKQIVESLGCKHADLWLGYQPGIITREIMDQSKVGFLSPLLVNQPYIRELRYCPQFPGEDKIDYNLNKFRKHWQPDNQNRLQIFTLAEMQAHALGIRVSPNHEPWITCEPNQVSPVVFCRSLRYHVKDFPWPEAYQRYHDQAIFIGLPDEHREFEKCFGPIPRYTTGNVLEMAQMLQGAKLIVCNESLPNAIALAMFKDIVQETWSKACVFDRSNAIFFKHKKIDWPNLKQPVQVSSPSGKKVHFITIVLDGMPYIARHLDIFNQLKIPWHWHIVEGVAAPMKDTQWCAKITPRLSEDGTGEYLESIKGHANVSIYQSFAWPGKVAMVNEPLKYIKEPGYVFQVDSDEIWTTEKIQRAIEFMESNPRSQEMAFYCRYFVGPDIIVGGLPLPNSWGNKEGEWLRLWRFAPGDLFKSHEPPQWERDKHNASINRWESSRLGLYFDHFAYVLEKQVAFKEKYYQYANAVEQWKKLQANSIWPAPLKNFLPWVDDSWAQRIEPQKAAALRVGPGSGGSLGLGDVLLFTAILKQVSGSVLELPESIARFKPLFEGIYPVEVLPSCVTYPLDLGDGHYAKRKLRALNLNTEDYLPYLNIPDAEVEQARKELAAYSGPYLVFCPYSGTPGLREPKDPKLWDDLLVPLKRKFTILVFTWGGREAKGFNGCVVLENIPLRKKAAYFVASGNYLGVDTGDLHLMLAVGGKIAALCPEEGNGYVYACWQYQSPRALYLKFGEKQKAYDFLARR